MTPAKKNLAAESERIAAEYETALAEVAVTEQTREIEIRRLAGQVVLSEITADEARTQRQSLDADLAAKRDRLAVLHDAVPEVERRAAEEAEAQRQASIKKSGDTLAKAIQGRYNAAKNFARDLRAVENSGAELVRHRALVDEAVAAHLERFGEPFEWPKASDEEWEASEEVVAIITAGPLTPVGDAAREVEELERTRALQETEQLDWAVREPTRSRIDQLPPHLRQHPRVVQAEKERDERIEAQKAARAVKREEHEEQATPVGDKTLVEV